MSHVVCFPNPITGYSPEFSVTVWKSGFHPQTQHSSKHGFQFPRRLRRGGRILMCSDSSSRSWDVPVLSSSEVVERLRQPREGQEFLAMYSSVVGGITTDPAAMVIPIDDHMVHRGHGVFDTAMIAKGYLYELDQHLDRIIRSAFMAKIPLPFERETIKRILIQTASVSKCRYGSLRYWLSAGPGNFLLSPSQCRKPALYAIVVGGDADINNFGVKVITSSIPIKPPEFATMKSVNYLPNVLSQMEAESQGAFAGIWVDDNGYVAEGPNMNVAFVTNGGKDLVMPRFDNVLSGCTAKRILTLAEKLLGNGLVSSGMLERVRVKDITVEEGKKAHEMMLIGSGVFIRPVVQWDDQRIGDGREGPIAYQLLQLLVEDLISGPPSVRIRIPY